MTTIRETAIPPQLPVAPENKRWQCVQISESRLRCTLVDATSPQTEGSFDPDPPDGQEPAALTCERVNVYSGAVLKPYQVQDSPGLSEITLGGPGQTFSRNWTIEEIARPQFGVLVSVKGSSNARVRIKDVRLRVYFSVPPEDPSSTAGQPRSFSAVAHSHVSGRRVVVSGNGGIKYSDDGETWLDATVPSNVALYDVVFAVDHFIAVGKHGTIFTSDTGEVWERVPTKTNESLFAVCAEGYDYAPLGRRPRVVGVTALGGYLTSRDKDLNDSVVDY